MGSFLSVIGRFFGAIFREMIPALIAEWKKPRKVWFGGRNKGLKKEMDKSIKDQLENKE